MANGSEFGIGEPSSHFSRTRYIHLNATDFEKGMNPRPLSPTTC